MLKFLRKKEIKIGDYVTWNKKAHIDYNKDHWWATNKQPVKVIDIKTHEGTIWAHERILHFETPIEKNWAGPVNAVFEHWVERCSRLKRIILKLQNEYNLLFHKL